MTWKYIELLFSHPCPSRPGKRNACPIQLFWGFWHTGISFYSSRKYMKCSWSGLETSHSIELVPWVFGKLGVEFDPYYLADVSSLSIVTFRLFTTWPLSTFPWSFPSPFINQRSCNFSFSLSELCSFTPSYAFTCAFAWNNFSRPVKFLLILQDLTLISSPLRNRQSSWSRLTAFVHPWAINLTTMS